jgi:lipid-binding SYLF domain-containing protein
MKNLLSLSLALLLVSTLLCHADMSERIHACTQILEKRQGSVHPIPPEIFANAKGIAICTITKGGIGIGGQGGDGIVMVHHDDGTWRAPSAFDISGVSLGAQLGFSTIRYIIILNTEQAVGQFIGTGKVKWDATATGTAGDDTGVEGESTRDLEKRAVIVYRDSGGIFGGATFGGSSLEVNNEVNQDAYGEHVFVRDILEGKVQPPKSAGRLYSIISGKR